MKPSLKGIKRIIFACKYSLKGLYAAYKYEAAFRQELLILILSAPAIFLFKITNLERLFLIGSLLLIIIVELLNSAIEAAIDRIGLEKHELSARAKDLGSASVFIAIILAIFTWVVILL